MNWIAEQVARCWRDERGGDAVEYALVSAIIVLGLVAAMTAYGDATGNTFNTVDDAYGA